MIKVKESVWSLLLVVLLGTFPAHADTADVVRMREDFEKMTPREREKIIYKMTPSEAVYGKIIDSQKNPLPGAGVWISWFERVWPMDIKFRKIRVVADKHGEFQYVCHKTNGMIKLDAEKEGYAPTESMRIVTDVTKTSKENPAVVVLRKRGEISSLLSSPRYPKSEIGWFDSGKLKNVHASFDILSKTDSSAPKIIDQHPDFTLEAVRNAENNCWTISFSATNQADGVIWSDELLFEAPETGYQPKVTFDADNRQTMKKHLYVRKKDPLAYARITFAYGCGNSEAIRFSYSFVVNPYGERTFEYDERFDQFWREKKKWVEDAKTALREGRYPEKVDIDAFIKAKEKEKAGGLKP